MDAAKNSVKKILSKSGQHDTTVYESQNPAIQHETVSQNEHHREQVALDREVHQHHHHTTEQPIHHQETLAEQHHHREAPMEHREFKHGDDKAVQDRLDREQAQYKDSHTRVEGERTKTSEPVMAGEHVHHHVHEKIQPIIHKQTVEPHVVHTTVPVHEVHHNEHKHHGASALPAMTMDDFKKGGGVLGAREERQDRFPGEPRSFDGERQGQSGGIGSAQSSGVGHDSRGADSNYSNLDSSRGQSDETARTKPSLMDKLNPKVDSNGDGKAGFMK